LVGYIPVIANSSPNFIRPNLNHGWENLFTNRIGFPLAVVRTSLQKRMLPDIGPNAEPVVSGFRKILPLIEAKCKAL
jgi:hypothetical protein